MTVDFLDVPIYMINQTWKQSVYLIRYQDESEPIMLNSVLVNLNIFSLQVFKKSYDFDGLSALQL